MAEKEQDQEKQEAPAKKKGMPAIILVAVGAILGGVGVVFAVPPKTVEVPAEPRAAKIVHIQHPDVMEYSFNPRTEAGKAYATVNFYFVYEVSEDKEAEAFGSIKTHWDRARSNVLLLLRARTLRELNTENGQTVLAMDMVDELDASLFPGHKGGKVARVVEVLWNKFMIQ